MTNQTRRLGLTGGIGCGKSTAAAVFAELGACVIDADAISRRTTAPQGAAIEAIVQRFGMAFVAADGSLNRDKMRELIFTDPSAKQSLEAIIHPLVQEEMARQYQQALQSKVKLVVYDIPLLVESPHWRLLLDQILVIDCTVETQIARVMARSKLARETVLNIIASQASREQRMKAADIVIHNESISIAQLRQEVTQVAHQFGL